LKLSNNEIVEFVYRNFKVKQLINKMISASIREQNNSDLEQFIYEYLLNYNNVKLNRIHNDNKLRQFISQIILRQRNGGNGDSNTYYTSELKLKSGNEFYFDHYDLPEEDTYNVAIDIIIEYIDKMSEMDDSQKYTSDQLKYILAFTLLKKYFMSDLTQSKLAEHLKLSRLTVSKLLKLAREDILIWWNKTGQYKDKSNM